MTGWMWLRSDQPGQRFFELGTDRTRRLFCTPFGGVATEGARTCLTLDGPLGEEGPTTPRLDLRQWWHLAVVLDGPRHSLTFYTNGVRAGQTAPITHSLESLLASEEGQPVQFYLGKSHDPADPQLNALLHDVRVYGVALTPAQIGTIHQNASAREREGPSTSPAVAPISAETRAAASLPKMALLRVPEVAVETRVGVLPRLPRTVPGVYRDGRPGPAVRILWPAPTNNHAVRSAGTYVLQGRIPGSELEPRAVVTVKAEGAELRGPVRELEAFPLERVTLNLDAQQRSTPFQRHRDKFLQGLAQADPDRFLYMFRNAFGQPQPKGAQALGGWDSETTRLRGHATGHYLTALAQAYASAGFDPAVQDQFRGK
ncbi:MAG: Ig-like domain-containing protein, partial [Verrucomicrobiales bacterium]|nr:Ig-like domain-containing protein [Verrucomicrobiales bacterium]